MGILSDIFEPILNIFQLTTIGRLEAEQNRVTQLQDQVDDLEVKCQECQKVKDSYYHWADNLAYSIADEERIGIHEVGNNPWDNALAISNCRNDDDDYDE